MNDTWTYSTTEEPEEIKLQRGLFWLPIDMTIGVIQCISCCACLLYALYAYKNLNMNVSKSFIILTIICLTLFLMTAITITINGWYYNYLWYTFVPPTWNTWQLGWLFWSFGQGISYILFIIRLQSIFNHTTYSLKTYTIICLATLIFVYLALWICMTCIPLYLLNKDTSAKTTSEGLREAELWHITWLFSFIVPALDVIITVSMMYMFISRLFKLITTQTVNEMSNFDKPTDQESEVSTEQTVVTPPMSFKDRQLMNVAIRISILTLVSLLGSILTVVFRGWSAYLKEVENDEGYLYAGIDIHSLFHIL